MKVQEVPEEFREHIEGYMKTLGKDLIRPYFKIDRVGDYITYNADANTLQSDFGDSSSLRDDAIKDVCEKIPNLPYSWVLKIQVEFVVIKEVFESDLFQGVYVKEEK